LGSVFDHWDRFVSDSPEGRVLLFIFAAIAGGWALLEMTGALRRIAVSWWRAFWRRRAIRIIAQYIYDQPNFRVMHPDTGRARATQEMLDEATARIAEVVHQVDKNFGQPASVRLRKAGGLPPSGSVMKVHTEAALRNSRSEWPIPADGVFQRAANIGGMLDQLLSEIPHK